MTTKEFEAQKQGIIDFIGNNFDTSTKNGGNNFIKIIELVGGLQPPRPTCSTCKHFIQELDNAGSCRKLVANEIINFNDGIATLVFTDFGCNWHSEYEEVKNA